MLRTTAAALLCSLVAALPGVEPAQALPLETALTLALQRNETAIIAQARLEQAEARYRFAVSSFVPRLSANAGWNNTWEDDAPFGGNRGSWESLGASVTWPLFDPAAFPALKSAKSARESRRLLSDEERRALAFATARTYLAVLGTEQATAAAERQRAVAQQTLDTARTRVEAGLSAQGDINRTELQLARSDLSLTEAARQRDAARLALAEIIAGDEAVTAPLAAPGIAAPPSRDAAALAATALGQRQDLEAQALAIEAARQEARAYLAQGLPSVDVGASVARTWSDDLRQYDSDTPAWRAGVTVTWQIFDGGGRYARADEARARAREGQAALARAQRGVASDIRTALVELAAAEESVKQGEVQDRAAKANAADVDLRFKTGLATALETADAAAQAFQAETDLVRGRFRLALARLELRSLAGAWPLTDVDPAGRR